METRNKYPLIIAACLCLLSAWLPRAQADVFHVWINPGVGDWNNATNWDTGVPVDTGDWDVARINNGGTAVLTNVQSGFNETQVGNNGVAGNLIITNGGNLTVNDWLVVARNDALGNTPLSTLTVASGGVLNKGGSGFLIADNNNGNAQMFVTGNGIVNVTGGWNSIGNSAAGGTLTLQDNAVYNAVNGDWNLGDYGAGRGSVFIKDNATLNIKFVWIGKGGTDIGALWQTGGTINGASGGNEWQLGGAAGSFGFYNMTGGFMNNPNNFQVGASGKGILYQSGGTNIQSGWCDTARNSGSQGVAWITGGLFQHTGTGTHYFVAEQGRGDLTVSGSGTLETAVSMVLGGGGVAAANLNLNSGGTVRVPLIERWGGVTSYLNFNGGILQAKAANPAFLNNILTEATVYSGNAIVDTAGYDVTVAQALVAPYGDGVKSIPITDGGAGYMAPPIVQIDASGVGSGATAVAQIDLALGKVTNIVVTCSGYGYGVPGVTLIGGGPTTAATLGIPTLVAVISGGLTKNGNGTLTLTGANTYTNTTVVNAGTLITTPASTGLGNYTVANGAGLGVNLMTAGTQLTVPNVTLGSSAATTLAFDLGGFGNPSVAPLNVTGAFAVNGPVTVNVADAFPQLGQFPLVKYGSRTGAGSFALGSLPVGVQATILTNVANSSIDLNITAVALPRWDGQAGGNWDIGITTNWVELSTGLPAFFAQGNAVLFDDAALGTTSVNLVTTVNPNKVTVTNSSLNYIFSGSGKISGAGGLTKQGTGGLALNTLNDYSGPTRLEGGTVSVTNLANYGSASPLGKSNLVSAGGTLSYSGPAVTINRGYTVAGGGTLDLQSNVTLSGAVSATSGNFTKAGVATLTYTAATTDNRLSVGGGGGAYVVSSGTVVMDGAAGQTNNIVGETWIGQGAGSVGRVDLVNGTRLNTDIWTVIGRGGGTGTMLVTNSTLSHNAGNDLIVGGDAGSIGELDIVGNSTVHNDAGWFLIGVGGATGTYNQSSGLYTNAQGYTRFYVGRDFGGVGVANLSGTAVVSAGNDLHVGVQNATGTLTLSNSAAFSQQNGWTFIGGNYDATSPTSAGTVILADNATMTLPGRVHIGFKQGSGTLNMVGGSIIKNGGEAFMVGEDSGIGVVNQSAGTITCPSSELWVADFNATGTYNLSGTGVINVNNNWMAVGRNNGIGILNMTGGTINKNGGGNLTIGSGIAGSGTINQSGGIFNMLNGETWLGEDAFGGPGAATYNLSGTGVANFSVLRVGQNGAATGTFSLNGGQLNVTVISSGSTGASTFNFNGGTLRAATNAQTNFMSGIGTANVLVGGAKIDTGTNNVSIVQALLDGGGNGGLTKTGNGTLALNGANTYLGTTTVSAGTLGGNGTITGPVVVSTGATLAPGSSIGMLTLANTLNLAAGSTTVMELNKTASTNDSVTGITTVTYGGTLVLKNLSGALAVNDTFTLFSAGTRIGSFSSVVSQTPNQTVTWDVSQLTVNGTVKVLSAVAAPVALAPVVSAGKFNLAWPANQIGWQLQSQVNALAVGLSNNWVVVPGSTLTNQVSLPLHSTEPAEFFRLVFPAQ